MSVGQGDVLEEHHKTSEVGYSGKNGWVGFPEQLVLLYAGRISIQLTDSCKCAFVNIRGNNNLSFLKILKFCFSSQDILGYPGSCYLCSFVGMV